MDVLGVDQSLTATGLARIENGVVETELVTSEAPHGAWETRTTVRYHVGLTLKFAPRECLSVIEAPIIPRHGGGLALERAWLFGLLFDQLIMRGPVATVHPSTRALYATGNGKAEKHEVVAAMKAAFPALTVKDDNVADGLTLAAMGARWLSAPVDGSVTSRQLKAMRSAHWPDMKGRAE